MDPRLTKLIFAYTQAVAECVDLLAAAGATMPKRDYDWPPEDFPPSGTLADGREYHCHGVGCVIKSAKGRTVDFDFGENGETTGFCEFRLKLFLGTNPRKFGFDSHAEMIECFNDATQELVRPYQTLYYLPS